MKRTIALSLCACVLALACAAVAQESCQLINYRVKSGDTLSAIADKYLNNPKLWKELLKYNNISDPNLIYPGDVIRIPSADVLQKLSGAKTDEDAGKIIAEDKKQRKELNFRYRANTGNDSGRSTGVDIYATGRDASGAAAGETLKLTAIRETLKTQPIEEVNRDPVGAR